MRLPEREKLPAATLLGCAQGLPGASLWQRRGQEERGDDEGRRREIAPVSP